MSHVAGSKILPTLMLGGSVHLLRGFDPDAVLATIARERINVTLLVPTMIYLLLDHPTLSRTDISSLELLLYGASPMSPARLLEGLERIGPVFSQLYGQTECYPISVLRKADHDRQLPYAPGGRTRGRSCFPPAASRSRAAMSRSWTSPTRRSRPVSPGRFACPRRMRSANTGRGRRRPKHCSGMAGFTRAISHAPMSKDTSTSLIARRI